MTHAHVLTGCRPSPLGSYLQGLGVLRLVGGQVDAEATGHWSEPGFVLATRLSRHDLLAFFLGDYAPTPMVSPWNKGAGYRGDGKSKKAEQRVASVLASTDARFRHLRDSIRVAQKISNRFPDDKEFTASKDQIISMSRSELPDPALEWLDAAIALTADGPVYPHILGTGGNLGRLDLSSNAMEHFDTVLGFEQTADKEQSWSRLEDALFGTQVAKHVKAPAGQYSPGQAGGINTSSLGDGDSLVNPWSFILQLEGAMTFASGVTRRLGSESDGHAAMPFTVRPTTTGSGHLAEQENTKGELWLPLWETPSTAPEVRRLFAEARLRWKQGAARSGIDAARAVSSLGVDRGVASFARTVIAERLGQSPLAVSAGRFNVYERSGVALTARLDGWLARLRGLRNPPGTVRQGIRRADGAVMGMAHGAGDASLEWLTAIAELDAAVSRNGRLRDEEAIQPVPPLPARAWLPLLDDGTPEFAVAAAAASLHESPADDRRRFVDAGHSWRLSVRDHVRGTKPTSEGRLRWDRRPADTVLDVVDLLAHVHVTHATHPRTVDDVPGEITTMRHGTWLRQSVVEAFVNGLLDERRILTLLQPLLLLDPRAVRLDHQSGLTPPSVSPAWRLLAPLWAAGRPDALGSVVLTADSSWPTMLVRGAIGPVAQQALVRLRTRLADIPHLDYRRMAVEPDGRRLAAALFLPISPTTAGRLIAKTRLPGLHVHQDNPLELQHSPKLRHSPKQERNHA